MGKYLGLFVGPKAGDNNWTAPTAKFLARTQQISCESLPLELAAGQFTSRAVSMLGYVGQFMPPPERFRLVELRAAHKLLSAATSSLSTNAAYDLPRVGAIGLSRPSAYVHASRIRAAHKTFEGFEQMHLDLAKLALEGNPLSRAISGDMRPLGWVQDAYCTFMYKALHSDICDGDFPGLQGASRKVIDMFERGLINNGLQQRLYKSILSCTSDPWQKLIAKRCEVIGVCNPTPFDMSARRDFIQSSKGLPIRARMAVIKTWTNGWATTERFHEEVTLPCIFGCGGRDNVAHYLQCDSLWTLLLSVVGAQTVHLKDTAAVRACLENTSQRSVLNCWFAFQLYHALKLDHRGTVDRAVADGDFTEVAMTALELLTLFAGLGEQRLHSSRRSHSHLG